MRKLTTLLTLLLLCVVGAQAATTYTVSVGPSNGEFYRADGSQSPTRWAARFVSNGEPQVTISTTANKFTVARTGFSTYDDANPLTWTISVQDGYAITGYKIVGTATVGTGTATDVTGTLTPSEGGSAATFTTTSGSLEVSGLSTQSTTFTSQRGTSDDVNISFTTYEVYVESTQPTLTYKVMWDGAQVASAEANRVAGAASLPASLQRAFCTYTYNPETITDATEEVIVTATWNGPVAIAPNFAEASWYYIRSNAKGTYLTYEADATDNVAVNVTENDKAEKLWWAFAGNPYDGFTIYNKTAGSDKILGSPYGAENGSYRKASHCSMAAPGTRVSEKFYFNEAEGNFCIADASGFELNVRSDDSYIAYYSAYATTAAPANVLVAELAYQFYPAVGIEVNTTNFDYYGSNGSLGNWAATLVSKNAPEIRVVVTDNAGRLAGNVQADAAQSATNFVFYSGQNAPSTYTISCPSGYELLSYTLTHNSASDKTVTPTEGIGTIDKQDDGTTVTINVTDINATEASFSYSGTNNGLVGTLTIRYHRVSLPAYVTYIVNDEGGNEVARYADIEVEDGAEIAELPAAYRKAFMTYTYDAPVTATYGTPVIFTATEAGYDLPFKVSTEGNEVWYILKAGSYYSYVGGKGTSYSGRDTSYYYAFFGNPETGFTIKNGNGQFINHNTTAWSSPITMSDEGATFMIEEAEGGFRMRTNHATEPSRILYLGYYNGYGPFTVWTDLKSANDGILHAIPVGITNLESLSNNKCYTLTAERGSLGANASGTALATTFTGAISEAGKFAIINFDDQYYLWSVDAGKFVVGNAELSDEPGEALSFEGNAPFLARLGGYTLNMNSQGVSVSTTYNTPDQGNMYAIEEAGDFDPANVLGKLLEGRLVALYTALSACTFGDGLGEYSTPNITESDRAQTISQVAPVIENKILSAYQAAYDALRTIEDDMVLNMPDGKFFTIYNEARGAYMGTAASGKHPNASSVDAAGIYYVTADGTNVVSYDQGMYLTTGSAGAPCGMTAGEFTISDAGSGKYYFNGGGYLVIWTSASDRLSNPNEFAVMTVEEVTSLPVEVTSAGWATLNLPVAVEVPEGVTAYVGKIEGEMLNFSEVGGVLPANTPVILEAAAGTYDFAITDAEGTVEAGYDALVGTIAAQTCEAEEYYTLQMRDGEAGMYPYSGTTLKGFKAYMSTATAAGVRGFSFGGVQTGLSGVETSGASRAAIYDLQGRRVQQGRKGVYVVNGKKVLF